MSLQLHPDGLRRPPGPVPVGDECGHDLVSPQDAALAAVHEPPHTEDTPRGMTGGFTLAADREGPWWWEEHSCAMEEALLTLTLKTPLKTLSLQFTLFRL